MNKSLNFVRFPFEFLYKCRGETIVDLNQITCSKKTSLTEAKITFTVRNGTDNIYMIIPIGYFENLKSYLQHRAQHRDEIERLTKENEHLRGVLAAMPGFGEDYKSAKIEFEHVKQYK